MTRQTMKQNDSCESLKWSQHPILGMFFWMFGKEKGKSFSEKDVEERLFMAKDSLDDMLKEYLSVVQTIPTKESQEVLTNQIQNVTINHWNTYVTYEQNYTVIHQEGPETSSPQWGFFVPITPTIPELYSKTGSPNSMPNAEKKKKQSQ
jgi:hypothetical protein